MRNKEMHVFDGYNVIDSNLCDLKMDNHLRGDREANLDNGGGGREGMGILWSSSSIKSS